MKRKISYITCLVTVLLFLPSAVLATVIDFEDAAVGKLEDGYESLHWSNVSVGASSNLLSGNVGYGNKISIYTGPFDYFNLISMDVASEKPNTIWIEAYTFSDRVFLEELELDELEETFLDLNLMGITRLNMWSDGNSTFLIDNLKVTWLCGTCTDCGNLGGGGGQTGTFTPPRHIRPPVVPPMVNPPKIIFPTCPPPEPPGGTVPPNCPPPEPPPAPVPEPSTWILLASGLALMTRFSKIAKRS